MYLHKLHLSHVRNLKTQTIEFGRGFNCLTGPNGAGKTAVLESIALLARGRSFRTGNTRSLIQYDQNELIVRGEAVETGRPRRVLALARSRSGQTRLQLDGERRRRLSDFARLLPLQTILPDVSDLIFGSPTGRRTFLDWGLFHVEPGFLQLSSAFRRVLAQRNAWLKSAAGTDVWSEPYLEKAIPLSEMRKRYVEVLNEVVSELGPVVGLAEKVALTYDWGGLESAEEAQKKLSESAARDVKFGLTHRGPHRGDLQVKCGDRHAAEVLSRGQAKLAACVLNLAQAMVLGRRGEDSLESSFENRGVFLIDDFGAELDQNHWEKFLQVLLGLECQIIATATDLGSSDALWEKYRDQIHMFHVKHGTVEPAVQA